MVPEVLDLRKWKEMVISSVCLGLCWQSSRADSEIRLDTFVDEKLEMIDRVRKASRKDHHVGLTPK